uniref:autism susceptibility gene 2 protein-like isoform X2 n=1 Tax=Pristiophorus japonicus TaxID=55135 RepID=UPI00398F3159
MDGPPRSSGYRQSRRSRSQRDRERKMAGTGGRDSRLYSPSSGSDREAVEGPGSSRPRPPRRRRRESTSCEEDIIDGFAIASFVSLEALEHRGISFAHLNSRWDLGLTSHAKHFRQCSTPFSTAAECRPRARVQILDGRSNPQPYDLKKDTVLKPPDRVDGQRKRPEKRKTEDNRPSPPCESRRRAERSEREQNQHNGNRDRRKPPPAKKVKTKGRTRGNESTGGDHGSSQRSSSRGAGSDPIGDEPVRCPKLVFSSTQQHVLQTVWQRISFAATDDGLSNLVTAATKMASDLNGAVTPKGEAIISGLERSQERNQESDKDPLLVPSPPKEPAAPSAANPGQPPAFSQAQAESSASARNRTPAAAAPPPHHHHHHHHHHHTQQQRHPPTPARVTPQPKPQTPVQPQHQTQPKVQPFTQHQLVYSSLVPGSSRSSTPSKTVAPASQLAHRASTPSSLSLTLTGHGFAPALRPSSHPHHPGLPPPPPLTSAMLQVAGHPSTAAVAAAAAAFSEQEMIRQELNSRYLSSQGTERSPALGPPPFQFHQHSHQHQHTHQHTHQHFAPYPAIPQAAGLVPAPAPSMVHAPGRNYFQAYHAPVSGIPSVLPPAGPFSSLQGAFQPKAPNPELASRSGAVPHALLQKDPRLTDAYRPTIRKPGKWCAMHVRIAWMIYRHQEKNKMMHMDHHKLDFTKTDLLTRGPSVFGPIAHSHDLTRPATLFTATGAVHPASSPFAPPSTLNTFLNPPSHLDPYTRSPTYGAIGQLTGGAFGGLGNPAVATSTVFAHKDGPGAQAFGSPREQWNRLHQTPPSFPTPPPPWPRPGEGERERERGGPLDKESETDKREVPFIKEEKERDGAYSRHPVRSSPAAPKTGSATPAMDDERGCPSSSESRGSARERERERERERAEPPRDHFKRESQLPALAEDSRGPSKSSSAAARDSSPYARPPAPEGPKPGLLRELARKHEVKVKEERKEEHEMAAAAAAGFEAVAQQQQLQRGHVAGGGPLHPLHSLHPLQVPMVVGQVNGLGVLERNRVLAGPFLGVSPHPAAGGGERLAAYGWDPFRDPWREAYRGQELGPLHQRYPVPQPQPQARFYERERQLLRDFGPEGLLAEARREQEQGTLLEEQLLLREEYEQRARLLASGFLGPHPHPHPHHHHHHHYPRVSPSLVHQGSLLSKTPPMATLGAPPPLISSSSASGGRPASPRPRPTPLSTADLRELAAYSHKDRESR